MADGTSGYIVPAEAAVWRRISWPAIFGGTFLALAIELLFTAFGCLLGSRYRAPAESPLGQRSGIL